MQDLRCITTGMTKFFDYVCSAHPGLAKDLEAPFSQGEREARSQIRSKLESNVRALIPTGNVDIFQYQWRDVLVTLSLQKDDNCCKLVHADAFSRDLSVDKALLVTGLSLQSTFVAIRQTFGQDLSKLSSLAQLLQVATISHENDTAMLIPALLYWVLHQCDDAVGNPTTVLLVPLSTTKVQSERLRKNGTWSHTHPFPPNTRYARDISTWLNFLPGFLPPAQPVLARVDSISKNNITLLSHWMQQFPLDPITTESDWNYIGVRNMAAQKVGNLACVSPTLRNLTVTMIQTMSLQFHLLHNTFFQAVSFLDEVLKGDMCGNRARLTRVAVTCLWISIKLNEAAPPTLDDFTIHVNHHVTTHCVRIAAPSTVSIKMVRELEMEILRELGYDVCRPFLAEMLNMLVEIYDDSVTRPPSIHNNQQQQNQQPHDYYLSAYQTTHEADLAHQCGARNSCHSKRRVIAPSPSTTNTHRKMLSPVTVAQLARYCLHVVVADFSFRQLHPLELVASIYALAVFTLKDTPSSRVFAEPCVRYAGALDSTFVPFRSSGNMSPTTEARSVHLSHYLKSLINPVCTAHVKQIVQDACASQSNVYLAHFAVLGGYAGMVRDPCVAVEKVQEASLRRSPAITTDLSSLWKKKKTDLSVDVHGDSKHESDAPSSTHGDDVIPLAAPRVLYKVSRSIDSSGKNARRRVVEDTTGTTTQNTSTVSSDTSFAGNNRSMFAPSATSSSSSFTLSDDASLSDFGFHKGSNSDGTDDTFHASGSDFGSFIADLAVQSPRPLQ